MRAWLAMVVLATACVAEAPIAPRRLPPEADTDTDADAETDTDTDTDTDADTDTDSDTDADTDTDSDTGLPTDTACTGCTPCEATAVVPWVGDPLEAVRVPLAHPGPFAEARLAMRPVDITAPAGAVITTLGPVTAFDATGAELAPGSALPADPAPQTVYLQGAALGSAGLIVDSPPTCGVPAQELPVEVIRPIRLGGRVLAAAPHFEYVRAFEASHTISVAIDPSVHADRVGLPYDLYVVPHRTAAEWAADPVLVDAGAGVTTASIAPGSVLDNLVDAWSGGLDTSGGLLTRYDLVLDFGQDGLLDPGDLIEGLARPAAVAVGDLTAPGPYTPTSTEFTDTYWLTQKIYGPAEIDTLDPVPLVVISHGNGHEYTWYGYLGRHLASHGFVVMSHRNDTQPGPVTAARTTRNNTDAFLGSLDTIAGGALQDRIDTSRIVWLGHSRGGEGVLIAYDQVRNGLRIPDHFTASDIALVSSIAPTAFEGPDRSDPNDVDFHLLAGGADGDVTGGVGFGGDVQYFRLFQRGTGEHLVTYVHGATHNDFNCCGVNDALFVNAPRIGRFRSQKVAKATYLALLLAYVEGEDVLSEYLWRVPEQFSPTGTNAVVASQLRPADAADILVIDDFQTGEAPELSSLGTAVTATVSELVEGPLDDRNRNLAWRANDPMNGMTQAHNDGPGDERGVVFEWLPADDGAELAFALPPAAADLRTWDWLSFRACQGTRHPITNELDDWLSFSAVLVDGSGAESAVDFAVYGRLTDPFERRGEGAGVGWVNEFQSVRIPIDAFTRDGIALDLHDIASVRFRFGPSWGSPRGRVGMDDIALIREAP